MTIAGTSCSPRRVGSASRPSRTKSPIWAIQPSALAKLWNATRLGSPMLPSTRAAEVRREEAGDVQGRAHGIREHGERDDADGEEGGGRPGDAAQQLAAEPAHGATDDARRRRARPPRAGASSHHGSAVPPGTPWAAKATTRMTTGASLKPDSASSIPDSRLGSGTLRSTAKTAAASVEVTMAPMSSEIVHDSGSSVCAATATTRTDTTTPTRREHRCGRDRVLDVGPRRRQATLGEDEHEGGIAEHPRDRGVVELDAGAGVAEGEADAEVDEQRRQARADREAHGRDRDEEHERADEEHARQVVEVHARRRDGCECRSRAAPRVWWQSNHPGSPPPGSGP